MGWRSWEELDKSLQGRCKDQRKLANNTWAIRHSDGIAIRLHATDILFYKPDGSVVVDCQGWRSVTTAARLGEHWPRDSKYRIISLFGTWVWSTHGWEPLHAFCDGDTILPSGELKLEEKSYRRETIEEIRENERKRRCERAKQLRDANPVRYKFNAKCLRVAKRVENSPVEKWKPEDIQYLKNSELRRRVLNHFGWDRVMAQLPHEVIHKAKDAKGNEMELVMMHGFAMPDDASAWLVKRQGGVHDVLLLKVICPSTGSFYTLRVPPEFVDCELARRWTLHDEGENQTQFIQET